MATITALNLNNAIAPTDEVNRGLLFNDPDTGLNIISGFGLAPSLNYTPFSYAPTIAKIAAVEGAPTPKTESTVMFDKLSLTAGSSITIKGYFVPGEPATNSFAFAVLGQNDSDSQAFLMDDHASFNASQDAFFSIHIDINHTGNYSLVLGVADEAYTVNHSGLIIKSVTTVIPNSDTSPTLNGLRLTDNSQLLTSGTSIAPNGVPSSNALSGLGAAIVDVKVDTHHLISQDGGGAISDNGAGLISQDGGGAISDNGAGLISQDGGGLTSGNAADIISHDSGGFSYHTLSLYSAVDPAPPEAPVFALTKIGGLFDVLGAEGLDHNLALENGNFASVSLYDSGGSDVHPQLQIFSPSGAKVGGLIENLGESASARATLYATTLSDGRIVEVHQNTSTFGTYGTIYNQDGSVSVATFTVSNPGFNERPTALLALSDGRFVVAITRYTGGGGSGTDFLEVLNGDGTVQQTPFLPAYSLGDMEGRPSLTELKDGSIMLIDKATNPGGLVSAVFDKTFTTMQQHTLVAAAIGQEVQFESQASVAVLGNGNFVAFYHLSGNAYGPLVGQIFRPDGTRVGDQIILPGDNTSQIAEQVIALPKGGFIVGWVENNGTSAASVGLQSYFDNGNPNGEPASIPFDGQFASGILQMSVLQNGNLSLIFNAANGHDFGQIFDLKAPTATIAGDSPFGTNTLVTTNETTTDATFIDGYGNTVVDTTDSLGRLTQETVTSPAGERTSTMTLTYAQDGTYHTHLEQKTTAGLVISDAAYGQHGEIDSQVYLDGVLSSTHVVTFNNDGSYTRESTIVGADGHDDFGYAADGSFLSHTHTDSLGNVTTVAGPGPMDLVAPTLSITGVSGESTTATRLISGTVDPADAGATVTVRDGVTLIGTVVSDQQGHWTLPFSGDGGAHAFHFNASARDHAGNTGVSNTTTPIDAARALFGGPSADVLTGGTGNDLLDGREGNDTMTGGLGNDLYYVQDTGDVIVETLNGGLDYVIAYVTYTLPANVEAIYTMAGAGATGNELNNLLFATYASAAQTLDGQGGNDILYGTLTGNDTLIGGGGNDALYGFGGSDWMLGGVGNDAYFVTDAGDVVQEYAGEGTDTIYSAVNYTLPVNVEILVPYGDATSATGNGDANVLFGGNGTAALTLDGQGGNDSIYGSNFDDLMIGGAGNDFFWGFLGNDTMQGGADDDTYIVEQSGDLVQENAGQGNDTVYAAVDYVLPTNVENLFVYGAATSGTGNSADNLIVNAFITTGVTLTGGGGNDTFLFIPGTANGTTITDFDGNGAGMGDVLEFAAYGAGATFTNIDATHWQVNYNGGASHDVITFSNAAAVHASDVLFV